MATETTGYDNGARPDPREVGQEYATGTIDLDGTGAGSITVNLSGDLSERGLGLVTGVTVDDGSAALSSVSPDSVDVDVTGGTADATVTFEVIVSEDRFAL